MNGKSAGTFVGTLGRDPETHYTSGGMCISSFNVCVNKKERDGNKRATWWSIKMFGKVAETMTQYLSKGSKVYIHGELDIEEWDDKQTGQKRQKVIVKVFDFNGIELLSPRQDGQHEGSNQRGGQAPGNGWGEEM